MKLQKQSSPGGVLRLMLCFHTKQLVTDEMYNGNSLTLIYS